jgi:hypothetical protein
MSSQVLNAPLPAQDAPTGDIAVLIETSRVALSGAVRSRLIRNFFASVGESESEVASLGVDPDRVIEHLTGALKRAEIRPSAVELVHIRDAAIAAACVDGRPGAWLLLEQMAEKSLIRAAESFQTRRHATVRARNLLADVKRVTTEDEPLSLNLRRYAGDASLRGWLVERLLARIALDLAESGGRGAGARARSADRLGSTLKLLRSERVRLASAAD